MQQCIRALVADSETFVNVSEALIPEEFLGLLLLTFLGKILLHAGLLLVLLDVLKVLAMALEWLN